MRLPEEPDGAHEERTVAGDVQTHGVDLQLERTIEVVALPGLHLVGDTLCVALGPSLGVRPRSAIPASGRRTPSVYPGAPGGARHVSVPARRDPLDPAPLRSLLDILHSLQASC